MNRRQFLKLSAGATAALVVADALPSAAFDALPVVSPAVVSGRRAIIHDALLKNHTDTPQVASLWITDGQSRICMYATRVMPNTPLATELPPMIMTTEQRLVLEGNVTGEFTVICYEPSSELFTRANIERLAAHEIH